jgi:4-aminobutyrate--pyruvate transaminase
MVWYYFNAIGKPQKKKLIARVRGLSRRHRDGRQPDRHGPATMPTSTCPAPACCAPTAPAGYHYGEPGETEAQFVDRIVGDLEALIEREGADTIAAFFAEPVQGAGGVIVPPAGYFEKVGRVLKKHDILLVADEVICGFGRTGSMFGCETYAMQPDIMTVAKALSSSYLPISATLLSRKVYEGVAAGSRKQRHVRARRHLRRASGLRGGGPRR